MLSSDLDSEEDKDKSALDALLETLIINLNMQSKVSELIHVSGNHCHCMVKFKILISSLL